MQTQRVQRNKQPNVRLVFSLSLKLQRECTLIKYVLRK